MTFEQLIKDIPYIKKKGDFSIKISGLQYDSRGDCSGKVFFCLSGDVFNGHDFIDDAVKKGAAGLILEEWKEINSDIPVIQVNNSREVMAKCANTFYGDPSNQMNLIGVTGTNGKTTVSYLVKAIYDACDRKGGLIGTVKCLAGEKVIQIDRTTPESVDLQSILNTMTTTGINDCVMEVSSHSVVMKRISGTVFKTMVFTNLSQDHLDFHEDMENYFNAKKELFDKESQTDVVNVDDEYGKRLFKLSKNAITYGVDSKADFKATDIKLSNNGLEFKLIYPKGEVEIKSYLGGLFNVYNCLAAIASTYATGLEMSQIKKGIESLKIVPGRLQFVKRKPFNVIVDYAHTPDGLLNLLEGVRCFTKGRLITVFGCGGDRDRGKRPKMGHIAMTHSDFSIVTTDNPRSEEPSDIINEIIRNLDNEAYWVEEDRREAISKALKLAKEGDSVIIAGKGHEKYQEIKGKRYPFDDVAVIEEIFGEDVQTNS